MELGNLIFGNSRGRYSFPDRDLVDCIEWVGLSSILEIDSYGIIQDDNCCFKNKRGGITSKTLEINPYYWGECDCGAKEEEKHKDTCSLCIPNFIYYPENFTISWYKYPFRDSYMNKDLSPDEIKEIFKKAYYGFLKEWRKVI